MWIESLFDGFKRRCVCHDICRPTITQPEDRYHQSTTENKISFANDNKFHELSICQKIESKKIFCNFTEEEHMKEIVRCVAKHSNVTTCYTINFI